jgi:hypothetical protein
MDCFRLADNTPISIESNHDPLESTLAFKSESLAAFIKKLTSKKPKSALASRPSS